MPSHFLTTALRARFSTILSEFGKESGEFLLPIGNHISDGVQILILFFPAERFDLIAVAGVEAFISRTKEFRILDKLVFGSP
jgi:hypothetical protein